MRVAESQPNQISALTRAPARSDDMTLEAAKTLVVKVMSKPLDSTTLSAEKRATPITLHAPSLRRSPSAYDTAAGQWSSRRSRDRPRGRFCTRC